MTKRIGIEMKESEENVTLPPYCIRNPNFESRTDEGFGSYGRCVRVRRKQRRIDILRCNEGRRDEVRYKCSFGGLLLYSSRKL